METDEQEFMKLRRKDIEEEENRGHEIRLCQEDLIKLRKEIEILEEAEKLRLIKIREMEEAEALRLQKLAEEEAE